MLKKYTTKSALETRKLGKEIAKKILKKEPQPTTTKSSSAFGVGARKTAVVLGLQGGLGSGKTTFLQGFAKGLGVKEKILSPTFVIMKRFQITKSKKQETRNKHFFKNFYHIDCYRIKKPKEILNLGFRDIVLKPENIAAIEWPEKIYPVKSAKGGVSPKAKQFNRVKKVLPQKIILIKFIYPESRRRVNKNKREISIDFGENNKK